MYKHFSLTLILLFAGLIYGWSQQGQPAFYYPRLPNNPYLLQNVPENVLTYVNEHLPAAAQVAKDYNIPVDFLLCVAGLETGGRKRELSQMANNHFGIKNPYNEGPSYCLMHADYVPGEGMVSTYTCFKSYPNSYGSFVDYLEHLASRGCYLAIQDIPGASFIDWVSVVDQCGYATDPDYGRKLVSIKNRYYFDQLIQPVFRHNPR